MAQTQAQKASSARYRERHKEKLRERDRERRRKSPGHAAEQSKKFREKNPDYAAEWYQKNRERLAAKRREWYAQNKEAQAARCSDWNIKNRDKRSAHCRNRRALIAAAGGKHSASDIADLMKLQKAKCACCKISLKNGYDVDHIIPVSKGGSNARSNLQLLCPTCNRRKHAKDPLDFMRENGRLL